MLKIRDTITIGSIAGIISTLIFLSVNYTFKRLGYQFTSTWEATAGIFLSDSLVHTHVGYFIGALGQYVIGASGGVCMAYVLKFTGFDHYLLKGLGVGAFYWVVGVGIIGQLINMTQQLADEPFTNILIILDLVIFSIINVLIIKKYGLIKHKSK